MSDLFDNFPPDSPPARLLAFLRDQVEQDLFQGGNTPSQALADFRSVLEAWQRSEPFPHTETVPIVIALRKALTAYEDYEGNPAEAGRLLAIAIEEALQDK